ncbi:MAG: MFS transporter [Aestuariivita sp.]|nr:MFS transporter [Aestuariivita sp.]
MVETQYREFEPKNENLDQIITWVQDFCASHQPAGELEYKIQLIVEEIFLNVVYHVFDGKDAEETVKLALFPKAYGAQLIIEADGPEFNPLEDAPQPDLDASIDDRKVGGLGLFMVRELTDHASYERLGARNRLTFTFGKSSETESDDSAASSDADGIDDRSAFKESTLIMSKERCRPRGITFQILFLLLFVIVAGIGSTAALNFIKFERILNNATAARYDPVLRELERTIEESLRGGLTLSSTRTTQQLLERSVAQFDDRFILVVRDGDGEVLFATDEPADLKVPIPPPHEIASDGSDANRFLRTMSISQEDVVVGTVSLSHDPSVSTDAISEIENELRVAALVAVIPFLPLLIILAVFMIGRIEGRFYGGMLAIDTAVRTLGSSTLISEIWRIQKFLGIIRGAQNWTREITGSRPVFLIGLLILLALPYLLFGFLSVRVLEPRFLHEFETQTITAAEGVQRRVENAVSAFGGLHALRDVERVLDRARASSPGMSFFALTNLESEILHLSADFPAEVRQTLGSFAVSDESEQISDFEQYFRDTTGIALTAPVALARQSGSNLLVTELPIVGPDDEAIGALFAGVDIATLTAVKQDIWIDTGVVVFAVVLVAAELLILVFTIYLIRPAWAIDFLTLRLQNRDLRFTLRSRGGGVAQRIIRCLDDVITKAVDSTRSTVCLTLPGAEGLQQVRIPALSHIRLPLFLFFLSEAMLRPILPQFLGTFAPSDSDPNFSTGMVMAGFMAASLVSVLIGSFMSERAGGPRRVFFLGAISAVVGMFGHIVATDFASILVFRILTGFGYGLVYASAQVHVAQNVDPVRRTTGFSLFLAVIVAAEICGPAIGGIIADRFGSAPVFFGSVALIVFSALFCLFLIPKLSPNITDLNAVPSFDASKRKTASSTMAQEWRNQFNIAQKILGNRRFCVAIVCFAIPAKALLTGGLFLLVPLTVFANGGEATESARILMGYGIAILLLVSAIAPLADRWKGFSIWVAIGSIVAGVGFVFPHAWNILGTGGLVFLFISTLLFGVGQTLAIPTQISFLLQATERQLVEYGAGPILGLFRFLERLGSFAGPVIAGTLLLFFPPDMALQWMGFGAVLLSALGMSWFLAVGQQEEEEQINALLVET